MFWAVGLGARCGVCRAGAFGVLSCDLAPWRTLARTVLSFDRVFPKGTRLEVSPLNTFGLSCAPLPVRL